MLPRIIWTLLFWVGVTGLAPAQSGQPQVAWYATWKEAQEAARLSNRPIFLVSAAPQCHGVSGIW